jgi:hypothetical protein
VYVGPLESSGGHPQPQRRRKRQSLRFYVVGTVRTPRWTISDVALDQPWLQGGLTLMSGAALAGLALGAIGLPWIGQGLRGALLGLLAVPAIFLVGLLVVAVVLHRMGHSLEGTATFLETLSALIFALLPVWLLVPAALLRLLPGAWGGFLFFLAGMAILAWVLRLTYLAVREAHRFTGTQAVLTITTPITLAFLLVVAGFFLTALGVLAGLV